MQTSTTRVRRGPARAVTAGVLSLAVAASLASCAKTDDSNATDPQPDKLACAFEPTSAESGAPTTADKKVDRPDVNQPRTGKVDATFSLNVGDLKVSMDRESAPCNVAAIDTLIREDYYTDSPCHRLTTKDPLVVLQCGARTSEGQGGPGWTSPDEFPKLKWIDEKLNRALYPRGTVAIANTGMSNSGSSQLFFVVKDTQLAPHYTVVGTLDEASLKVLDGVLAKGIKPSKGPDGQPVDGDGQPTETVIITRATATS